MFGYYIKKKIGNYINVASEKMIFEYLVNKKKVLL